MIEREMVDKRKSGLELAIQMELVYREKVPNPKNEVVNTLSRSPGFSDWTDTQNCLALHQNTSSPEVQSSVELQRLTFPSARPQNPMEQSLIKIEPYSDEIPSPVDLSSARKDWIGPSYKPFDKKQTHHSSSELQPPILVPFSRRIPAERTQPPKIDLIPKTNTMTHQRPKHFPMPNIPTKTRSGLKRKEIDIQEFLNPQPSSRNNSTIQTVGKSAENMFCELCRVSCSSWITMQQHLKGRPHKAKMVYMQLKKRNCTVKQPRCNICQIFCSDRDAMEMHLKGQKHKAKLHELEESRRTAGGMVVVKKPVFCELCHVSCMNQDLFQMHLKGRQHVTRQEMKRRRMI